MSLEPTVVDLHPPDATPAQGGAQVVAALRARPANAAPSATAPLGPAPRSPMATTVLATLAVVAALWWGQRFLVPVAAGLMLGMLVAPMVIVFERLVRSRTAATLLSLSVFIAFSGAASWAFGGQIMRMADRMPEMIQLLADNLAKNRPDADSVLKRARDALVQLERAAQSVATGTSPRTQRTLRNPPAAASTPSISEGATVLVRDTAVSGSTVLMKFATDLSVIVFIAFFVLAGGERLTARFVNLWGRSPRRRARAERAVRETARQIRLYAGTLLVTNTVIGVGVWLAFWAAGLPEAGTWGVTAALLHVVPYLGMAVLVVLGAAETFLAHGTFTAALVMAAYLVTLSTLIGTVMTAWLQGRNAKMNPAAVFIGLVFWGAVWGVWGLFLGPALIVMIKVIAQNSRTAHRAARLMQG
jgi:predicted PurR-regulated permease PerM